MYLTWHGYASNGNSMSIPRSEYTGMTTMFGDDPPNNRHYVLRPGAVHHRCVRASGSRAPILKTFSISALYEADARLITIRRKKLLAAIGTS